MRSFFAVLLLFAVASAQAGVGEYDVTKIKPELLKGASAVKRFESIRFEIKDPGSAVYYYKTAITILDEDGDQYAGWSEAYDDQFTTIRSVNATLYDAGGNKIRSLKKADISDFSASDGSTLVGDDRVKKHNFYYKVYPYTVEYEVEIKKDELMFIPRWMPVDGENQAVELSMYEIVAPANYKIRYKAYQYDDKGPVIASGKSNVYHWEVNNLKAISREFACPNWSAITPTVLVGPTEFSIAGYKGNMNTWGDFGKFVYALKQNRDNLPDNIKARVHELTDKLTDPKKKIAVLYDYLQQNTRYISVQLGIGGWQPFTAEYVSQKKYGDCKALTNFMFALLKEAGIPSVYTLVKAGFNRGFMFSDFPSSQFNHVILSVPLQKDTVWLECTSQTLPAGYLSGFTANRYVLMVKEDGGYLVKTPDYPAMSNLQIRKLKAVLDDNGKLEAEILTRYTGLQQDRLFMEINSSSKKEQLEALKKDINLPSYDISAFDYTSVKEIIPTIDQKLNLTAPNYAQVSGKRIFILPNVLNRSGYKLSDEERTYDIELQTGFKDVDSVEIKIPNGYTVEAMPAAVTISNKFGNYSIAFKVENDKITMVRSFLSNEGRFPATDYKELAKTYTDIYKADRGKIVLIKKEG